ncbi:ATPase, AAA-type, core [Acididesulfobacillus acetoxydans]|uniref:ATPase, AAA-type, core n=1 Tax=Acididesulfobacillus acetoxydans TaxID=1561005 RepID=A0A8S0X5U7_9FIRM|nr:AAA family ATPase [Acididesulfobacillus acetoxydans]CAA7601940.1 ATPase, AAA-type, core [Acididesulfobacillus acetoxydans]CEJ08216.1 Stage V sporulation protein K [Acididesulfobacillus acetoxydans]
MPIRVTFRPDRQAPPVVESPQPAETHPQGAPPLRKGSGAAPGKNSASFGRSAVQATEKERVNEILSELDELIGLISVKRLIRELQAYVEIQKRRTREKLVAEPLVLHMIFRGNPGTGKTTVARIIGRLFKEMGVLQKGHIIECERADLVGEYIGHTAQKTREQVKKALGGVLFIDEAYSLARGGEKDFGKEAIDALVKAMEDQKDNLILILAGYRQEMEWFLQTNPGLRSRFPIHIDFPDYSLEELLAIGRSMFNQRQYTLTPEAQESLRRILQGLLHLHPYAGNARLIRNLVERTVRKQAVRLFQNASSTREELMEIIAADLDWDEV